MAFYVHGFILSRVCLLLLGAGCTVGALGLLFLFADALILVLEGRRFHVALADFDSIAIGIEEEELTLACQRYNVLRESDTVLAQQLSRTGQIFCSESHVMTSCMHADAEPPNQHAYTISLWSSYLSLGLLGF